MTHVPDELESAAAFAVSPDLIAAWERLWTNRAEPYALQQEDGTYRWVYKPCGATVLAAHLTDAETVAVSCTDEKGICRWLCLDADGADALPQLLSLAGALAEVELPGLVEASRRGGHMWLLLDEPAPAAVVRRVVLHALDELRRGGLQLPALEVYPDAAAAIAGALGHAVRLPLGIHRLTGKRYALFDEQGYPCAFTSTEAAMRFVLSRPRIPSRWIAERNRDLVEHSAALESLLHEPAGAASRRGRVGTYSPVIRWVDAHVSPLDLLDDLAPEAEMRRVGRGHLGWCPFHDDRAPDEASRPGTPSFYVVLDRRHGWSWRCLSSNCPQSWGSMRHPFELFQRLLGLTVRSAIVEACSRWPEADAHAARPGAERTD